MSVLLIRRLRPIGEPATPPIDSTGAPLLPDGVATHAGIGGAGRIVQSLAELGIALDAVRQLAVDPAIPPATLDSVDLAGRLSIVVLGSHLANAPEADARRAFLGVAARHLAPRGSVFVEHHPLDWAETAAETRATPGASVGMVKVRRHPPFVSAVSVYDAGGRWVEQPFTARVLTEAELAASLAAVGLVLRRRLGPTWLEAVVAGNE